MIAAVFRYYVCLTENRPFKVRQRNCGSTRRIQIISSHEKDFKRVSKQLRPKGSAIWQPEGEDEVAASEVLRDLARELEGVGYRFALKARLSALSSDLS